MIACVLKLLSKQVPEVFGSLHICTANWFWLVESFTRLPLWEAYYPYTSDWVNYSPHIFNQSIQYTKGSL